MKHNKSSFPQFIKRIMWFEITYNHQKNGLFYEAEKSSIHQFTRRKYSIKRKTFIKHRDIQ